MRPYGTRWFYDVSPEIHRKLAEKYIADSRYAGSYEKVAPGSRSSRNAVLANTGGQSPIAT